MSAPLTEQQRNDTHEDLLRTLVRQLTDAHALAATLRDVCEYCREPIQFTGSNTAVESYMLPAWRVGNGGTLCSSRRGGGHVPTHHKPGGDR